MGIKINNLTVTFKNGVNAVNHVNLDISGGIFGLLGENGAGKTTLMRVLTTTLKPAQGEVVLNNMLYCQSNYRKIRSKIGYLPQEIDLYPNLSVQECLEYMGELSGVETKECRRRIEEYLERTSLTDHRRKKMRQLSGGMKRRVGLIQALLSDPELLIIDEPTTGLDPEERIRIRNLLVEFSENRTVLFSTHVVEDLAATCSRIAVMKKGCILYAGNVRKMLEYVKDKVWICDVDREEESRTLEIQCHISSKQYTDMGMQLRVVSEKKPHMTRTCRTCEATLEDAYIWVSNRDADIF